MSDVTDLIRARGVIALVDAPIESYLFKWAMAVAEGGIRLVSIPVTYPSVAEVASDLIDEANLTVGVSGVVRPDQIPLAVAAGASFVLSPLFNPAILRAGSERGMEVICGAATPNEVARAVAGGAHTIVLFPVFALGGPRYVQQLAQQFPTTSFLAWGGVDTGSASEYLELGATGAVVDRGLFPEDSDPSATEVITVRARALAEMCVDVVGRPTHPGPIPSAGPSEAG